MAVTFVPDLPTAISNAAVRNKIMLSFIKSLEIDEPPKMPSTKYRFLQKGETITEGDKYKLGEVWEKCHVLIGTVVDRYPYIMRLIIT
jgi:hypothetical protein